MNKGFEDSRRKERPQAKHPSEDRPAWQVCLEDMTEIKRKAINGGISVEFADYTGKGVTVDIVGKDYEAYKIWEKPKAVPETKTKEPEVEEAKVEAKEEPKEEKKVKAKMK